MTQSPLFERASELNEMFRIAREFDYAYRHQCQDLIDVFGDVIPELAEDYRYIEPDADNSIVLDSFSVIALKLSSEIIRNMIELAHSLENSPD